MNDHQLMGRLGINLAFARLLLSANCSVIIADLSLRPEASMLVSQFAEDRTPQRPQAIFQKTDVLSWTQLDALFRLAETKFHGADIVCPGAGIFEPTFSNFWNPPSVHKPDVDPIGNSRYKTLDVNLTHPIRCTQLAISHFLSRYPPGTKPPNDSRGVIVHVSFVAAQVASLIAPLYHASKAAISHFVRTLRPLEERYGIRVLAVAPGVIETPLWTEHPDKLKLIN